MNHPLIASCHPRQSGTAREGGLVALAAPGPVRLAMVPREQSKPFGMEGMTNGPTKVVADMLDAGTKMSKQMFRPTIPIDTGNWQE